MTITIFNLIIPTNSLNIIRFFRNAMPLKMTSKVLLIKLKYKKSICNLNYLFETNLLLTEALKYFPEYFYYERHKLLGKKTVK